MTLMTDKADTFISNLMGKVKSLENRLKHLIEVNKGLKNANQKLEDENLEPHKKLEELSKTD